MPTNLSTRGPEDVRAANRLRALRDDRRMSRAALLDRLAADPISPTTRSMSWITAVEKAQTGFPWDLVDVLARALDCHPDEIRLPWITERQPG